MNKLIREERLKELKSCKKWEKINNGFWFMIQTFMLSMGLNVVIAFFIRGLSLEIKTTWYFPLACWMLVIMFQTIYMVTKQHTENVKEIDDKYKNLIDKIVMKRQTQFKNASLVSVVNGSIIVKDATGREHTFTNASVVSINNGIITIESEWKPQEGELIKMEGNGTNCYTIFKNKAGSHLHDYGYRYFREKQLICNTYGWDIRNVTISPVTPEEQKEFDDFCKSQGKVWNKEALQWEKYRWMPKKGESYFYILTSMLGIQICNLQWDDDNGDHLLYDTHNCFQTEKQAAEAAEKVKGLLKSL